MKATRKEVFDAINEERDYQDSLWGERVQSPSGRHSVPCWILYMEDYLREAREQVVRYAAPNSDNEALHTIRKIAAMAVVCMEQNGVQKRDMKDLGQKCIAHGICDDEEG